jgi:hypothetical protein
MQNPIMQLHCTASGRHNLPFVFVFLFVFIHVVLKQFPSCNAALQCFPFAILYQQGIDLICVRIPEGSQFSPQMVWVVLGILISFVIVVCVVSAVWPLPVRAVLWFLFYFVNWSRFHFVYCSYFVIDQYRFSRYNSCTALHLCSRVYLKDVIVSTAPSDRD